WLHGILNHRVQKARRKYGAAAKRQIGREMPLDHLNSAVKLADKITPQTGFPGRQLVAAEDAAQLACALGNLPANYQQVIRLRNWELRSFADIGECMNRSAEAARSLWSRAVQRLAEELEPRDGAGQRSSQS